MVFSIKFMTSSGILYIWCSLLSIFAGTYHMRFCSQSTPLVDFSVLSCCRLGWVNHCRVALLCLWILCSILSVPRGTICGLLASRKYLPLFVPLVFSTPVRHVMGLYLFGGGSFEGVFLCHYFVAVQSLMILSKSFLRRKKEKKEKKEEKETHFS